MSLDGNAEKAAIKTRLSTLCGGRIHDFVPEEEALATDPATGFVLPYIVLTFGSLYPQERDRSIEGADQQPNLMPVIVECWAVTQQAASATAGAVRTSLVGWAPDANNATEIELRGGGWFQQKDSSGRPVRFMESVTGITAINMSFAP